MVRVGRGDAGPLAVQKSQGESNGRTVVTVMKDDRCIGLIVVAGWYDCFLAGTLGNYTGMKAHGGSADDRGGIARTELIEI